MLLVLGAIVGFVASFISTLLGGGAGLIATPAFYYIALHIYGPQYAMQIALATCYGMSVCLSLVATYKHQRKGNIAFGELKYYLIFLAIGTIIGAFIVRHINTELLKYIFSTLLILSGIWMILHNDSKVINPPEKVKYFVSAICGTLGVLATSTTFTTMFFIKIGTELKKAISIASVCVLITSSLATVIVVFGVNIDVPNTYGYVSIPMLLASGIFGIIGSLLAVRFLGFISPKILKILFIVLMFVSGIVMLL
ncbi:hypothetical protein LO80_04710 [Candidatus Francisella endociliophora]|uniref:Probable membrane transporter protein n=1 Tax=Candidatus Francisella endociliophora TaxID=653937 RepID=A0A097EP46_9GAMM|nr:sulfite exporter TauE/SafE family protein [Francisella sp. FSC1006]AIT09337.1 hypothetical protein LO80_04710 [Francisella sp. FSC1006]